MGRFKHRGSKVQRIFPGNSSRSLRICVQVFCVWLSFTSCIEQISFPTEREGGLFVIDGRYTDENIEQTVFLGFSSNRTSVPRPIETAQLRLFDDQGNSESYRHDPERPGTYVLTGNRIKPQIGNSYHLQVALEDGRLYKSIPEKLLAPVASLNDIKYDFSLREESLGNTILTEVPFIDVFIDVDFGLAEGEPFYLRWDVEEVYKFSPTDFDDFMGLIPPPCYVHVFTSAQDINLFDGRNISQSSLSNILVGSQKLDQTFLERHYFSVYQRTISQEAYEYWRKIDRIVRNVGTIFDSPPAPIKGNMFNVEDPDEEILGYFEVASSQVLRFSTILQDLPIELSAECTFEPEKPRIEYSRECLDCLRIRNSSLRRPVYFDE